MKKAPKKLPSGFTYLEEKQLLRLRFTVNGTRYAVYGNTIKECEEKKDEKKELLKNSLHLEKQKITLKDYYNSIWLEEQKKAVKDATLWQYSKIWKVIEQPLGNKKLTKLQKADVIQFQNTLLKDNKSVAHVNHCTKLLKQILHMAVLDRIIPFNPCDSIKSLKDEKPKAVDTNHRALTQEETTTFLRYAENSCYYHLFEFLLGTGMRISEALALTWFDVDFDKKEIRINKTISRTSNTDYRVINSTKTKSSTRSIPLTDNLIRILKAQKERNSLLYSQPSDNRIFLSSAGRTSNYNTVNSCIDHIISEINKNVYFAPISAHAFRDTFATRCIEQGMNPQTLKAILGHSSLAMTMDLYSHVMPNTKYEELSRIAVI